MEKPSYSEHLEVLMAVVTYLAMNEFPMRQPKKIADDTSIDIRAVEYVLRNFKGLFRESRKTSTDHGAHFYSLQLRYALNVLDDDNKKTKPPLGKHDLSALLEFISRRASEETQQGTAIKVALVTASLSLLASTISIAYSFFK